MEEVQGTCCVYLEIRRNGEKHFLFLDIRGKLQHLRRKPWSQYLTKSILDHEITIYSRKILYSKIAMEWSCNKLDRCLQGMNTVSLKNLNSYFRKNHLYNVMIESAMAQAEIKVFAWKYLMTFMNILPYERFYSNIGQNGWKLQLVHSLSAIIEKLLLEIYGELKHYVLQEIHEPDFLSEKKSKNQSVKVYSLDVKNEKVIFFSLLPEDTGKVSETMKEKDTGLYHEFACKRRSLNLIDLTNDPAVPNRNYRFLLDYGNLSNRTYAVSATCSNSWRTLALNFAVLVHVLNQGFFLYNELTHEKYQIAWNMVRPIAVRIGAKEGRNHPIFKYVLRLLQVHKTQEKDEMLVTLVAPFMLKERLDLRYSFIIEKDEYLSKYKMLGSGRFGVIKQISNEMVVKILPWRNTQDAKIECLGRYFTEVFALKISSNKGLTKLYDYGTFDNHVWIITERCKESLKMWCKKRHLYQKKFTIQDRTRICILIWAKSCEIVASLHEEGIIHNDIKCDNILIRKKLNLSNISTCLRDAICVSDFGEAIIQRNDFPTLAKSLRCYGTERIQSPEMLSTSSSYSMNHGMFKTKTCNSHVSYSSDVWSLGCLLYEIITSEFLFDTSDWSHFFILLQTKEMGELPTTESMLFLTECLTQNQYDSISCNEIAYAKNSVECLINRCLQRKAKDRPLAKDIAVLAKSTALHF